MKKEFQIFLHALVFFTRIPGPQSLRHRPEYVLRCAKYLSLVGYIVGGMGAFVFWSSALLFPKEIAILLSMCSTILITGALHEDGFADVCDGFGGGWTKERILSIMKDSRLGTYGTLGIVLLLGLKFAALFALEATQIPFALIAGHSSSRFIATTLLYTHPYAGDTSQHKALPASTAISLPSIVGSGIIGILPFLFFETPWVYLLLIPMYSSKLYLGRLFRKWIGGQTGDCAGAVQQLSELVFYLSLYVVWLYI